MLPALRTNTTIKVTRKGLDVDGMAAITCLILPASDAVIALNEVPANKAYQSFFKEVMDIRIQDYLVDTDGKKYRVIGTKDYKTPLGAHTEATLESMWGT